MSLARRCSLKPTDVDGLRLSIRSEVPASMGVSSSASVEVATLRALVALYPDLHLDPEFHASEIAHLAWLAETEVVGAPCGTMDQIVVSVAPLGSLLPIRCRPGSPLPPVRLPANFRLVGWPSGVKHDVGASPYQFARTAAFMAKRMAERYMTDNGLAAAERTWAGIDAPGATATATAAGARGPVSLSWLAELQPSFVNAFLAPNLPASIRGSEFLATYGALADPGSRVDPDRIYPVLAALRFVTGEDFRVRTVTTMLRSLQSGADADADVAGVMGVIGELVSAAHGDYTQLGLGTHETDAILVALLSELGPARGVLGARVSGGGSGGTIVVLCDESRGGVDAVRELAADSRFDFARTGKPVPLII